MTSSPNRILGLVWNPHQFHLVKVVPKGRISCRQSGIFTSQEIEENPLSTPTSGIWQIAI
jgi:hypothetical protein